MAYLQMGQLLMPPRRQVVVPAAYQQREGYGQARATQADIAAQRAFVATQQREYQAQARIRSQAGEARREEQMKEMKARVAARRPAPAPSRPPVQNQSRSGGYSWNFGAPGGQTQGSIVYDTPGKVVSTNKVMSSRPMSKPQNRTVSVRK
jgi:hypothetical protein